jgi:hypothetical protein
MTRPPGVRRTPADTGCSRSASATATGTTAPTSSREKWSSARSVQPSVAFHPAARMWITSPVAAAMPAFTQPTSPVGEASTNVTSSRMFHGSS